MGVGKLVRNITIKLKGVLWVADLGLGWIGLRGKSWSVEEERQLRELIGEGLGIDRISKVMGKTRVSVMSKMYHLGLVLVDAGTAPPLPASSPASSSAPQQTVNQASNNALSVSAITDPNPGATSAAIASSSEVDAFAAELKRGGPLPSMEERLQVLNAALVALEKPELSMTEITRLTRLIQGTKIYQEQFALFVNYQALENKVLELERQLASKKKED